MFIVKISAIGYLQKLFLLNESFVFKIVSSMKKGTELTRL